jgi:hypothetical protein
MTTKVELFNYRVQKIKAVLAEHLKPETAETLAEQLVRGAEGGSELEDFENWLGNRFKAQLVWLNNDDYTRAITRALPQALRFAAADFGSTRQRDLGQLWTDTARGFLGEIAFQRFLKDQLSVSIEHDISMDKEIGEYISSDIKSVHDARTGYTRPPKINVSVKTGRFNEHWADKYGAEKTKFIKDVVFVRIGLTPQHFIAFLKASSFFETELLPAAEKLGELTAQSRKRVWNIIPEFESIPAYISSLA